MDQDFYTEYIIELFKKADLVSEDKETNDSYVASLAEELKKKIGLMIMNELSAEQMDKYSELVKVNSPAEKLGEFFDNNIADFKNKRDKIFQDFASNFLQRTVKMRQALNS